MLEVVWSVRLNLCKVLTSLLILLLSTNNVKSELNDVESIGWGGGGAFTSAALLNGKHYLSSDVAGIWVQVDGSWQPFVDGLNNYNVTALTVFNGLLYAITTDELYVSDGVSKWATTNIKFNTYRSVNDQPFATSEHLGILCVATRKNAIVCTDKDLHLTTIYTKESIVRGVFFSEINQQDLLFYSNKNLYKYVFATEEIELVGAFNNKIVSLANFLGKVLVATEKEIYSLENITHSIFSLRSSSIVNFFVVTSQNTNTIFISKGIRWKVRLEQLEFDGGILRPKTSVDVIFDEGLPHRKNQNKITKFLSQQQVGGEYWLTDYWGVYRLNVGKQSTLQEVTSDAINIVATDIIVKSHAAYITSMDNGVVKLENLNKKTEPMKATRITTDILNGHGWSMLYANRTLYAAISPWNNPNDFLFEYSENDSSTKVTQLSKLEKRESKGAFWLKSYTRELVYFNGIVSFKDGYDGGLVQDKKQNNMVGQRFTLGKYNKVYKAITELNGLLYIATCEGPPIITAIDTNNDPKFTIKLPRHFCAFRAYKHNDSIYYLGSQKGKSIIYKLKNRKIIKFLQADVGSAFYAMEINPENQNEIIVAGISWSQKVTSRLLVSIDGGKVFFDQTCLLTHKNGVAEVIVEGNNKPIWILQKVGGLLRINYDSMFNKKRC